MGLKHQFKSIEYNLKNYLNMFNILNCITNILHWYLQNIHLNINKLEVFLYLDCILCNYQLMIHSFYIFINKFHKAKLYQPHMCLKDINIFKDLFYWNCILNNYLNEIYILDIKMSNSSNYMNWFHYNNQVSKHIHYWVKSFNLNNLNIPFLIYKENNYFYKVNN